MCTPMCMHSRKETGKYSKMAVFHFPRGRKFPILPTIRGVCSFPLHCFSLSCFLPTFLKYSMEGDKTLDVDLKKPEVANNEMKVDLKSPTTSVVIPVGHVEEKKPEELPVVVDYSITNNEVCFERLSHL